SFSAEAKPSSDRDPERECYGPHASESGKEHEDLEWCRRRQHGGNDHRQQSVPPEQAEAAVDLRLAEPAPEKRFATFPGDRVEDETSGRRAKGGRGAVEDPALRMLNGERDDERVSDLRQREER